MWTSSRQVEALKRPSTSPWPLPPAQQAGRLGLAASCRLSSWLSRLGCLLATGRRRPAGSGGRRVYAEHTFPLGEGEISEMHREFRGGCRGALVSRDLEAVDDTVLWQER